MKPAYLIAYGPNDIAIISMIFESFELGLTWLQDNSGLQWRYLTDREGVRYAGHDGYIDEREDSDSDFLDKVFTRWYFGCGEADRFKLKEAEYATPLCGFDLD